MNMRRPWIEIVVIGGAIACALALVLAAVGVLAGSTEQAYGEVPNPQTSSAQAPALPASVKLSAIPPAASSPVAQPVIAQNSAAESATLQEASEHIYEGVVTCSRCGARHPADSHQTAATCSRACVRSGSGFTLVDGETLYLLEGDHELINHYAGQRAQVAGLMAGNTIHVSSVAAIK